MRLHGRAHSLTSKEQLHWIHFALPIWRCHDQCFAQSTVRVLRHCWKFGVLGTPLYPMGSLRELPLWFEQYRYTSQSTWVALSVQFSSFWFDNAASPILRRFSCRSWAPLVGVSYYKWSPPQKRPHQTGLSRQSMGCSPYIYARMMMTSSFFKVHHPSTGKPKALGGIQTQYRAWARHCRLSLYQYTTITLYTSVPASEPQ